MGIDSHIHDSFTWGLMRSDLKPWELSDKKPESMLPDYDFGSWDSTMMRADYDSGSSGSWPDYDSGSSGSLPDYDSGSSGSWDSTMMRADYDHGWTNTGTGTGTDNGWTNTGSGCSSPQP